MRKFRAMIFINLLLVAGLLIAAQVMFKMAGG